MNRKTVSISPKRQVTIPKEIFTQLNFSDEAEFVLRGNELVLRPIEEPSTGDFAEQILADLIEQGFSGKELLAKFVEVQKKIRPAVNKLLEEAAGAARGESESYSFDEVFALEDE